MSDKTERNRAKVETSRQRREAAYRLVKALAQADGIPLPNARNGGREFDEWLEKRLAQTSD